MLKLCFVFKSFFWFVKRFRKRSSKDLRKSSHRHTETHDIRREHFNIPQSKTLIKSRRPWLFSSFRLFVHSSLYTNLPKQQRRWLCLFLAQYITATIFLFSLSAFSLATVVKKRSDCHCVQNEKLAPNFINLNLAIFLQIDTRCRSICFATFVHLKSFFAGLFINPNRFMDI